MRLCHLGLLGLLLICFLFPALAPAVDAKNDPGDAEAKKKLEELKARLPAVLKKWVKEDESLPFPYTLELRLCRRTSPYQAKISIICHPVGRAATQLKTELVNAYLSYQDGSWTTIRSEMSWGWGDSRFVRSTFSLMLALDEAGGADR